MSKSPIRLGVVGYGFSSKVFHLPFIHALGDDFKVVAFFQRTEAPADPKSAEKGSHCTVDYPDVKHYNKPDEFFADENVDCVIVNSKQDTHAEYAEKALNNGKHVVVEKAFTRTTEEADRLIKLAKEKGKILTVFQNRRWDSDFLTLQKLVNEDALGEMVELEIHYDMDKPFWMRNMSSPDYTPGDGMTFGLGSHTIDQALLLFGRPTTVTGFLRTHRGIKSETEDTFTAIFQYTDSSHPKTSKDLLVTVKTLAVSALKEQIKYIARGTKGSYIKYGSCIQEKHVLDSPATDPNFGKEPEELWGQLTTKGEKAFDEKHQTYDKESDTWTGKFPTERGRWVGYYEAVRDAIRGDKDVSVKPEESRDGIRCIELIRESSIKGEMLKWS